MTSSALSLSPCLVSVLQTDFSSGSLLTWCPPVGPELYPSKPPVQQEKHLLFQAYNRKFLLLLACLWVRAQPLCCLSVAQ